MADREKVIKGLDCCASMKGSACRECPYSSECIDYEAIYQTGTAHLAADALDLLKEQEEEIQNLRRENHNILTQFHEWAKEHEAKPPTLMQDINGIFATCPMCGHKLHAIIAMEIDTYLPKYCSECGQAVKWNESEG